MAKWFLEDRVDAGTGEVYVLKGEPLENSRDRRIYKASRAEFRLIYNTQNKMIGYLFRYTYDDIYPKFSLFNSFGIVYNRKEKVDFERLNFEVIFEDQVIRLLAYEHPNKVKDYLMVGRWRSSKTDKITNDE
jgi:hypothetical protein